MATREQRATAEVLVELDDVRERLSELAEPRGAQRSRAEVLRAVEDISEAVNRLEAEVARGTGLSVEAAAQYLDVSTGTVTTVDIDPGAGVTNVTNFQVTNHGLSNNLQVNVIGVGTYFVIFIDANTFRLSSATGPGAAANFTLSAAQNFRLIGSARAVSNPSPTCQSTSAAPMNRGLPAGKPAASRSRNVRTCGGDR